MLLVVLLDKPSQHTFVTGLLFGITVAVKKQEILVAVDIDRRCLPPVLHRPPQRLVALAAHGDLPCAVFGFRRIHIIADFAVFEKLVVHIDLPALEIKVGRQAAELGNAEASPQEDDDLVTILLVDRIDGCKSKKAILLLLGQSGLFLRVILQDRIQDEVEGILSDTVILNGRVEGRFQGPFPVVDGLVGVTLLGAPLEILPMAVRFA